MSVMTFSMPWGEELTFDPIVHINTCIKAHKKTGRDHSLCRRCPELRATVEKMLNTEILVGSMKSEMPPETLEKVMEFNESAKPWGESCAAPNDTQPYERPVRDLSMDPDGSITGFEIKE